MISDEAVEAAKAAAQNEYARVHGRGERWEAIARTALEAAAPHMLADVWDDAISEGESSGWLHDYAADDLRKRNPYRSEAMISDEAVEAAGNSLPHADIARLILHRIEKEPGWYGETPVMETLARAQVHATLALVDANRHAT